MRSLAILALAGSVLSTSLMAQSLTEHAAAAAGATIGTAAGKPLGTALGKIFGSVDNSTSAAAGAKATKPVETKVVKPPTPETTATAPALGASPAIGSSISAGSGGGSSYAGGGYAPHRAVHSLEEPVPAAIPAPAPVPAPVKEPTVEEIAAVQVGASATEVQTALGNPESRVSIPGDDGHLLEICQYWAKGQALGTVRLDNGHVISVQTR